MCARRTVALLVALWVTPAVSHAGFIPDPDASEILIHLGEPRIDIASGFVDFPLDLYFGDSWLGRSLSFVGINVEQSRINGIPLVADSVHFSRFLFRPTPGSAIEAWGVSSQRFGSASTPGLEEWVGDPGKHSLPDVTDEMSLGTLRFDFGSTEPSGAIGPIGSLGPTSIDSLFVDLVGGLSSSTGASATTTVVGLLDENDPNEHFQFVEPRRIPEPQIANFEPSAGTHVIPEPSRGVIIALAIGCVVAVTRRGQLRRV